MHLHEMLIAVESVEMAQKNECDWLRKLSEVNHVAIGGGQREIRRHRANGRQRRCPAGHRRSSFLALGSSILQMAAEPLRITHANMSATQFHEAVHLKLVENLSHSLT